MSMVNNNKNYIYFGHQLKTYCPSKSDFLKVIKLIFFQTSCLLLCIVQNNLNKLLIFIQRQKCVLKRVSRIQKFDTYATKGRNANILTIKRKQYLLWWFYFLTIQLGYYLTIIGICHLYFWPATSFYHPWVRPYNITFQIVIFNFIFRY